MAKSKKPTAVKLIIGALFAREDSLIKAKKRLQKGFGPIDFASAIMPFVVTEYYDKEMGPNLKRQFLAFQRLIDPGKLSTIKLYTNRLERLLSLRHREKEDRIKRTINLDPGYISASKLVLATCKNYSHRIYVGRGIYAEATLCFHQGTFTPWPWTYPDYKSPDYIQCFNKIRELYLKQLNATFYITK